MNIETWLLFVSFAMITIIAPGPAVALAMKNGIQHGHASVLFSSLGNSVGLLMVASLSTLGLAAVIQTSAYAFQTLKFVGAVYLVYLGVKQIAKQTTAFSTPNTTDTQKPCRGLFMEGFLVASTNPKAILFFSAIFPQFIDLQRGLSGQFLILLLTFVTISFLVLMAYGLGSSIFRGWLDATHHMRRFNIVSGSVFIAFGIGLMAFSHKNN